VYSRSGLNGNAGHLLGTWMILSWYLLLGPLGAILLGGVAYSIIASYGFLGLLCALVLFSPMLLLLVWGFLSLLNRSRLKETEADFGREEPVVRSALG
jgi:membrane protein implicated in regulation of membrane protease activity